MADEGKTGNEGNGGNDAPVVDAARPEYLPESYWDPEAKSVKADVLTKDLGDLTALRTEREARLAAIPKDGKYAFDLPKDFSVPDGQKWSVDPNDPLAKSALDFAKANNLTQSEFTGMAAMWAKVQADAMTAERARFAEDMKALGTGAETRRGDAQKWLQSKDASGFTKEQAAELAPLLNSRHGIEALEAIKKLATVTTRGNPGNGADGKDNSELIGNIGKPGAGRKLLDAANAAKH